MNIQSQQMNAAAIDRHRLVTQVRAEQISLSARAGLRFERFARARGNAIYELATFDAIAREFAHFEWAEIDRLYAEILLHLATRQSGEKQRTGLLCREVRGIVIDKLNRLAGRRPGRALRATGRAVIVVALSIMFMAISSITSEICLHFIKDSREVQEVR